MVERIQFIDNADNLTANQNTWSEYVLNMRLKFAESFVHLQLEGDAREHSRTMSTTRKARDGYFYALHDFVTWYGDVRGTYLWKESEPTARQAGIHKQRLGLFPQRLPTVVEEPGGQTLGVSVLPPLPADVHMPPDL